MACNSLTKLDKELMVLLADSKTKMEINLLLKEFNSFKMTSKLKFCHQQMIQTSSNCFGNITQKNLKQDNFVSLFPNTTYKSTF